MDQLLEKVAEVKGMPASLAKRSAGARSKKTGEPIESVLAEWAGVDAASVSATPTEAPAPTPAPAVEEVTVPVADQEIAEDAIELIEELIEQQSGGEVDIDLDDGEIKVETPMVSSPSTSTRTTAASVSRSTAKR